MIFPVEILFEICKYDVLVHKNMMEAWEPYKDYGMFKPWIKVHFVDMYQANVRRTVTLGLSFRNKLSDPIFYSKVHELKMELGLNEVRDTETFLRLNNEITQRMIQYYYTTPEGILVKAEISSITVTNKTIEELYGPIKIDSEPIIKLLQTT